jgi:hypothetical protein
MRIKISVAMKTTTARIAICRESRFLPSPNTAIRNRWGLPLQFGLSPRAVVNYLTAPVVGHLLPPSNLIERAKTPDANLVLSLKAQTLMHGDLTARGHAIAFAGWTSTVTCDSPLKR